MPGGTARGTQNTHITSDPLHDHVAAHADGIGEIGAAGGALEFEEKGMVRRHTDTRHVLHLGAREKINHSARRRGREEEDKKGGEALQPKTSRDDSNLRWPPFILFFLAISSKIQSHSLGHAVI